MSTKLETFLKNQLKTDLPNIKPGDTVKVYQKIKEGEKERTQVFEGLVIARKHGKGISATIAVRKIISGIGVERTFPIYSPLIEKLEITNQSKVRRAKLYYLRTAKGKKGRLKKKDFTQSLAKENPKKAENKETEK